VLKLHLILTPFGVRIRQVMLGYVTTAGIQPPFAVRSYRCFGLELFLFVNKQILKWVGVDFGSNSTGGETVSHCFNLTISSMRERGGWHICPPYQKLCKMIPC
jgi:hypothetical protein